MELHPLCMLFPRMAGAEFSALVNDIEANGLRQPIVVHDGMILDGGNRYRACLEAQVQPTFTPFSGDNIVSFVMSQNLHRRHMTAGQQAAIVASAQDWAKAQTVGRPKSGNDAAFSEDDDIEEEKIAVVPDTVQSRVDISGASERTQRMADKVAREAPELAQQVAHGEISLPKALEIVEDKPKKEQSPKEVTQVDKLKAIIVELEERLQTATDAADDAEALIEDLTAIADGETAKRFAVLEAELKTMTASRDQYMRENQELKRQLKVSLKRAA